MRGNNQFPHEKSMSSYHEHCFQDAAQMLSSICDEGDIVEIYGWYRQLSDDLLWDFYDSVQDDIARFLGSTEKQRQTTLKKFKEANQELSGGLLFRILATRAAEMAAQAILYRDDYRFALAPGGSNRATAAGVFAFLSEVQRLNPIAWPEELCFTLGIEIEVIDSD